MKKKNLIGSKTPLKMANQVHNEDLCMREEYRKCLCGNTVGSIKHHKWVDAVHCGLWSFFASLVWTRSSIMHHNLEPSSDRYKHKFTYQWPTHGLAGMGSSGLKPRLNYTPI